jgi:hypothetical protein
VADEDDDPIEAVRGFGPLTSYEILRIVQGRTLQEARAEYAEKTRIDALADNIKGRPIAEWPPFDILWDTFPESYFRTLDGAESGDVDPHSLETVWVGSGDLDGILQPYNHRTADAVWSVGDANKAARALVHWSEGRPMSPVWIVPTTPGIVGIVGGNHRLAIARAKGANVIPILVEKKHLETVAGLIKLLPRPSHRPGDGQS